MFEAECTDTTNDPRTLYNVQSNENIATEELEILNGNIVNGEEGQTISASNRNMGAGNKNDGYANYYNAIQGNPKILVDLDIVNSGDSSLNKDSDSASDSTYFYLIEVGDICAFNHNNQLVPPFAESFNGKKFIVTSLTRNPGNLKVSLREI